MVRDVRRKRVGGLFLALRFFFRTVSLVMFARVILSRCILESVSIRLDNKRLNKRVTL